MPPTLCPLQVRSARAICHTHSCLGHESELFLVTPPHPNMAPCSHDKLPLGQKVRYCTSSQFDSTQECAVSIQGHSGCRTWNQKFQMIADFQLHDT